MKEEIILRYSEGAHINIIAKELEISSTQIMEALAVFKLSNIKSGAFSDEFRKIVAKRDLNGIPRNKIAKELMISQTTVRRCCREFGDVLKVKVKSEDVYMKIKGEFSMNRCPECNSKKVNEVNELSIYCMDCGEEFIFNDSGKDYIHKVVWENIS